MKDFIDLAKGTGFELAYFRLKEEEKQSNPALGSDKYLNRFFLKLPLVDNTHLKWKSGDLLIEPSIKIDN